LAHLKGFEPLLPSRKTQRPWPLDERCIWCEWSDLNRQDRFQSAGFKPAVFTYFTTLATFLYQFLKNNSNTKTLLYLVLVTLSSALLFSYNTYWTLSCNHFQYSDESIWFSLVNYTNLFLLRHSIHVLDRFELIHNEHSDHQQQCRLEHDHQTYPNYTR